MRTRSGTVSTATSSLSAGEVILQKSGHQSQTARNVPPPRSDSTLEMQLFVAGQIGGQARPDGPDRPDRLGGFSIVAWEKMWGGDAGEGKEGKLTHLIARWLHRQHSQRPGAHSLQKALRARLPIHIGTCPWGTAARAPGAQRHVPLGHSGTCPWGTAARAPGAQRHVPLGHSGTLIVPFIFARDRCDNGAHPRKKEIGAIKGAHFLGSGMPRASPGSKPAGARWTDHHACEIFCVHTKKGLCKQKGWRRPPPPPAGADQPFLARPGCIWMGKTRQCCVQRPGRA
eukprot:gene22332-biopygen2726